MIIDVDTKDRIEQFISIVDRIKSSRFAKETKRVSYQFQFQAGRPVEQTVVGFDEEDLRSMLWDLRKFTLKKDGVYFPDFCDLLVRNTANSETITNIQKCKRFWCDTLEKTVIALMIDGKVDTAQETLDKWIYGLYAHEKHSKDLKALGIGTYMHKANFVFALVDLIKIAAITANNAKVVLDEDCLEK